LSIAAWNRASIVSVARISPGHQTMSGGISRASFADGQRNTYDGPEAARDCSTSTTRVSFASERVGSHRIISFHGVQRFKHFLFYFTYYSLLLNRRRSDRAGTQ